jgi:hypothetical protein
MAFHVRKSRDRYLDQLAREPLFAGVSRPHIVVIGRLVDLIELAPGAGVACEMARQTVIVADGQALLTDAGGRAVASLGPHAAIGAAAVHSGGEPHRIVAVTPLRAFVVSRRELPTVAALAPRVASALAAAATRPERRAAPRIAVRAVP